MVLDLARRALRKSAFTARRGFYAGLLVSVFFASWPQVVHADPIEELEQLYQMFERGALPDFENPEQRNLFLLYAINRYSNHSKVDSWNRSLDAVAREIREHPDLTKEPLNNVRVRTTISIYGRISEIDTVLNEIQEVAKKIQSPKPEGDYWSRIERPEDLLRSAYREATGNAASDLGDIDSFARANRSAWWIALGKTIQRDLDNQARMDEESVLRGILFDLAHTFSLVQETNLDQYANTDGRGQISTLRRFLRDEPKEFYQQGSISVQVANGYETIRKEQLLERLKGFRRQLTVQETRTEEFTVRHLSLIESPFRSALGADCSTNTYLLKALESEFHYFTVTRANGSQGHVTIVMGTAEVEGGSSRVAMIDKIQNIPHELLPKVLEAIRQSLERKGVQLGIPIDLGGHNGIANDEETREFVSKELSTYRDAEKVTGAFRPDDSPHTYKNQYSRAYEGLMLKILLPLSNGGTTYTVLETEVPPSMVDKKVRDFLAPIYDKKKGNALDPTKDAELKLDYVEAMILFYEDPIMSSFVDPELAESILPLYENGDGKLRKEIIRLCLSSKDGALFQKIADWAVNRSRADRADTSASQLINFLQNLSQIKRYQRNAFDLALSVMNWLIEGFVQQAPHSAWIKTLVNTFTPKDGNDFDSDDLNRFRMKALTSPSLLQFILSTGASEGQRRERIQTLLVFLKMAPQSPYQGSPIEIYAQLLVRFATHDFERPYILSWLFRSIVQSERELLAQGAQATWATILAQMDLRSWFAKESGFGEARLAWIAAFAALIDAAGEHGLHLRANEIRAAFDAVPWIDDAARARLEANLILRFGHHLSDELRDRTLREFFSRDAEVQNKAIEAVTQGRMTAGDLESLSEATRQSEAKGWISSGAADETFKRLSDENLGREIDRSTDMAQAKPLAVAGDAEKQKELLSFAEHGHLHGKDLGFTRSRWDAKDYPGFSRGWSKPFGRVMHTPDLPDWLESYFRAHPHEKMQFENYIRGNPEGLSDLWDAIASINQVLTELQRKLESILEKGNGHLGYRELQDLTQIQRHLWFNRLDFSLQRTFESVSRELVPATVNGIMITLAVRRIWGLFHLIRMYPDAPPEFQAEIKATAERSLGNLQNDLGVMLEAFSESRPAQLGALDDGDRFLSLCERIVREGLQPIVEMAESGIAPPRMTFGGESETQRFRPQKSRWNEDGFGAQALDFLGKGWDYLKSAWNSLWSGGEGQESGDRPLSRPTTNSQTVSSDDPTLDNRKYFLKYLLRNPNLSLQVSEMFDDLPFGEVAALLETVAVSEPEKQDEFFQAVQKGEVDRVREITGYQPPRVKPAKPTLSEGDARFENPSLLRPLKKKLNKSQAEALEYMVMLKPNKGFGFMMTQGGWIDTIAEHFATAEDLRTFLLEVVDWFSGLDPQTDAIRKFQPMCDAVRQKIASTNPEGDREAQKHFTEFVNEMGLDTTQANLLIEILNGFLAEKSRFAAQLGSKDWNQAQLTLYRLFVEHADLILGMDGAVELFDRIERYYFFQILRNRSFSMDFHLLLTDGDLKNYRERMRDYLLDEIGLNELHPTQGKKVGLSGGLSDPRDPRAGYLYGTQTVATAQDQVQLYVLHPEDLPTPEESAGYNTLALLHPKMRQAVAWLAERGVEVVIDTSLYSGLSAQHSFTFDSEVGMVRRIYIGPNAPWHTFRHEFNHAITWLLGGKPSNSKTWKELLEKAAEDPEAMSEFRRKYPEMYTIMKQSDMMEGSGLSQLAIEETLAVHSEIREYFESGGQRISYQYAVMRMYALWHQLNYLLYQERESGLTPEQVKLKAEVQGEYFALELMKFLLDSEIDPEHKTRLEALGQIPEHGDESQKKDNGWSIKDALKKAEDWWKARSEDEKKALIEEENRRKEEAKAKAEAEAKAKAEAEAEVEKKSVGEKVVDFFGGLLPGNRAEKASLLSELLGIDDLNELLRVIESRRSEVEQLRERDMGKLHAHAAKLYRKDHWDAKKRALYTVARVLERVGKQWYLAESVNQGGSFVGFYASLWVAAILDATFDPHVGLEDYADLWAHFGQETLRFLAFSAGASAGTQAILNLEQLFTAKIWHAGNAEFELAMTAQAQKMSAQQGIKPILRGFYLKQTGMLAGIILTHLIFERYDPETFWPSVMRGWGTFMAANVVVSTGGYVLVKGLRLFAKGVDAASTGATVASGGAAGWTKAITFVIKTGVEIWIAPYIGKQWDMARLHADYAPRLSQGLVLLGMMEDWQGVLAPSWKIPAWGGIDFVHPCYWVYQDLSDGVKKDAKGREIKVSKEEQALTIHQCISNDFLSTATAYMLGIVMYEMNQKKGQIQVKQEDKVESRYYEESTRGVTGIWGKTGYSSIVVGPGFYKTNPMYDAYAKEVSESHDRGREKYQNLYEDDILSTVSSDLISFGLKMGNILDRESLELKRCLIEAFFVKDRLNACVSGKSERGYRAIESLWQVDHGIFETDRAKKYLSKHFKVDEKPYLKPMERMEMGGLIESIGWIGYQDLQKSETSNNELGNILRRNFVRRVSEWIRSTIDVVINPQPYIQPTQESVVIPDQLTDLRAYPKILVPLAFERGVGQLPVMNYTDPRVIGNPYADDRDDEAPKVDFNYLNQSVLVFAPYTFMFVRPDAQNRKDDWHEQWVKAYYRFILDKAYELALAKVDSSQRSGGEGYAPYIGLPPTIDGNTDYIAYRERTILRWYEMNRNNCVLPVPEKIDDTGKSPVVAPGTKLRLLSEAEMKCFQGATSEETQAAFYIQSYEQDSELTWRSGIPHYRFNAAWIVTHSYMKKVVTSLEAHVRSGQWKD